MSFPSWIEAACNMIDDADGSKRVRLAGAWARYARRLSTRQPTRLEPLTLVVLGSIALIPDLLDRQYPRVFSANARARGEDELRFFFRFESQEHEIHLIRLPEDWGARAFEGAEWLEAPVPVLLPRDIRRIEAFTIQLGLERGRRRDDFELEP